MILSAILSLGMFLSGASRAGAPVAEARTWPQSEQQAPIDAKPIDSQAAPSPTAQSPQPPATAKRKAAPPSGVATAQKKPAATKRTHSSQAQAKAIAPCKAPSDKSVIKNDKNEGAATPSAGETSATSAVPAAADGSPAPDLPPCPPAKVVIRNGGTTEADVQLTGGSAAAKTSTQAATTTHMLESTEDSLKKMSAAQLNAAQQETMKQAHQYVAQSKEALEAGDLELARNLAVKAHLLADQMLKPQP